MSRWQVIVSGPDLIQELRKEKEAFSFVEGIKEVSPSHRALTLEQFFHALKTLQVKYMMGPTIAENRYHVAIVRNQLTRNLGFLFDDIKDEIVRAIDDNIPIADGKI